MYYIIFRLGIYDMAFTLKTCHPINCVCISWTNTKKDGDTYELNYEVVNWRRKTDT